MPVEPVEKTWMDGKLVAWDEARIPILTHSVHYGTGVFEGIRAYRTAKGTAVFRLNDHVRRLFRSALLYHMDVPYSQEAIEDAIRETVVANGMEECYIRPLVHRGFGEMGINPLTAPVNVSISVWASPWPGRGSAERSSCQTRRRTSA